ncbi:MAG: hypothetical protein SFX73_20670 [Kofleriaceae bacterium]|nr:hypothetical protein [Kofleriaceae bacterium]
MKLLGSRVALLAVAACAAEHDAINPADEVGALDALFDGDRAGPLGVWTDVGLGVAYQHVNTGSGVLIAYGGYSARLEHSAAWATALVDARLGAAGVGHIYAVQGPADPAYAAREIANTRLRAHVLTITSDDAPLYIVAHSSGSFVAHELLAQEYATGDSALLWRTAYANLDGGGAGLTANIVANLGATSFVYARDPTLASGLSQNHGSMIENAARFAADATLFEVVVPNTGCASGAGWCLHDVVITSRPHDPNSFDIARDYTNFEDRTVTTSYLEPLILGT